MATIEYIEDVLEGYREVRSVTEDYREVRSMMDGLINKSEYKLSFFAKQLKISLPVFYIKKKTGTFTFDEIRKIVDVLKQEAEEDARLIRDLGEMRKTQKTLSPEEFKKMLQS
jgi:hypothetical protein